MSVQDSVEKVLKEIHILISKGRKVYDNPDEIIVNKKEIFALLENLNLSIDGVLEAYEITEHQRELLEIEDEKKSRILVERANNQVEDIYAAALIYTDDALARMQSIMTVTKEHTEIILEKMQEEIEEEKQRMKDNQLELREQMQDFKDTDKYLAMIKDTNKQREKEEKEKQSKGKLIQNEEKSSVAKTEPEIKINTEYFQQLAKIEKKENDVPKTEELISDKEIEETVLQAEITADLDAEYFQWQEDDKQDEKTKEKSSRKKKKKKVFMW